MTVLLEYVNLISIFYNITLPIMLALCLMLLVTYIMLKNNAGMIGSPIAAFETLS